MAKKKKQKSARIPRNIADGHPVRNHALLGMTDSEWRLLMPHLHFLPLPSHLVLHEPGKDSSFLHFPNSGLISLVVVMNDSQTVEAGIIGKEGVVGLPAVMSFPRHPLQEIVQIPGDGFRISLRAFRKLAPRLPELRKRTDAFVMSLGLHVAQTAACNRLHDLEQRLARWLLMAHDRVDSNTLAITQDFLATMMGTDRPSVTLAEGVLKRAGAIEHSRGVVTIVDRGKLENCACECYSVIRNHSGNPSASSATTSGTRLGAQTEPMSSSKALAIADAATNVDATPVDPDPTVAARE